MPAVLPRELPLCEPARRGGWAPRAGRGATWVGTRYLGCELQGRGPGHRQRYLLTASDSWSPGAIHGPQPVAKRPTTAPNRRSDLWSVGVWWIIIVPSIDAGAEPETSPHPTRHDISTSCAPPLSTQLLRRRPSPSRPDARSCSPPSVSNGCIRRQSPRRAGPPYLESGPQCRPWLRRQARG